MFRLRLQPLLVTLTAALLGGCQAALFAGLNTGASDRGIVVERDLRFSPEHELALDLYRPQVMTGPVPVVVFFYGGSWRNGNRGWTAFVGRELARRGALVVMPDYRKAPQVQFPAFVEDAAQAVAWTRTRLQAMSIESSGLHLMGHSAGAHIAALLATDARYLARHGMRTSDLTSVIGLAGPYDLRPITGRKLLEVFGPPSEHAASQPIEFVDGDEPPFLLLHGNDDGVVWPRNSERFAQRLREAGVAVELKLYPDLGHPGILLAFSSRSLVRAPVAEDVARHLGLPDPARTPARHLRSPDAQAKLRMLKRAGRRCPVIAIRQSRIL